MVGLLSSGRLNFTQLDIVIMRLLVALELCYESQPGDIRLIICIRPACRVGGRLIHVLVIESSRDSRRIVPNRTLVLILSLFQKCLCAAVDCFDTHVLQICCLVKMGPDLVHSRNVEKCIE